MLDFKETKHLLKTIAQNYNCKIWICEKIGRRISYIEGLKAGNEYYLPPEILYEDEKYVIFTENLSKKDEKLFKLIHEVIENVRNNQ